MCKTQVAAQMTSHREIKKFSRILSIVQIQSNESNQARNTKIVLQECWRSNYLPHPYNHRSTLFKTNYTNKIESTNNTIKFKRRNIQSNNSQTN